MSNLATGAAEYYHQLLETEFRPSDWAKGFVDRIRRHWVPESPMNCYALRPFLLDRARYDHLKTNLQPVGRALVHIGDRLARDPALRRQVGIPEYLEPLLEIDSEHGKPTILGRIDTIQAADGRLAVIEFNSEPQSIPFQQELTLAFEDEPITTAFRRRYRSQSIDLFECMLDALIARGRARGVGLPTIAILDRHAQAKSPREATWFRPHLFASSRGCIVVFVDPEELTFEGGKLRFGELVIDIVSFVGWGMLINEAQRLGPILEALRVGAVDAAAGISRGLLTSSKATLELLSDPEHRELIPAEFHRFLDENVPWTRVLRDRKTVFRGSNIDLLEYVEANPEHFVIKPSGRGGGVGVVLGADASPKQWSRALKRGVSQRDVVQERVIPARERWPVCDQHGKADFHEVNTEITPYLWNGDVVEGVLCRIASSSILYDFGQELTLDGGIDTTTWIVDGPTDR